MATPSRGIKSPVIASTEAIGASRSAGTEWSWSDDEDLSQYERPTLIPPVAPIEKDLLESESFAGSRQDRITPPFPIAPDSGLVPVGNSWDVEPARQRYLSRDEIDSWSSAAQPATAPPRRAALPSLFEDDPLASEFADGLSDELSLDLDVLYIPDSLDHAKGPSKGPPTSPYPLNDWDEVEETGVRAHRLPHQRREPITLPPPSTLNGLCDPLEEPALAALDFGPRGKSTGTTHPRLTPVDPLAELRDRVALGDFSGALVVAEGLLDADPSNREVARHAEACRERLRAMYIGRLGSLAHTPRVALPPDQVRWLSLDHRAGFVLSCVDGYSTIDEILDVSGMPQLDTLRILFELSQQRIIAVD